MKKFFNVIERKLLSSTFSEQSRGKKDCPSEQNPLSSSSALCIVMDWKWRANAIVRNPSSWQCRNSSRACLSMIRDLMKYLWPQPIQQTKLLSDSNSIIWPALYFKMTITTYETALSATLHSRTSMHTHTHGRKSLFEFLGPAIVLHQYLSVLVPRC